MTKFIRPDSLKYPQVYYNFSARDVGSEKEVKYNVQDVLEEDFDYAVEILIKYYLPEEPLCVGRKFSEKPEAVEFMGKFYKDLLLNKLSIGCYKEESNELVGVNIMDVKFKDDVESHEFSNEDFTHKAHLIDYAENQYDIFEHFEVDSYLTSYALLVHPNYRNRGIATEILKARIPFMKKLGMNVSATVFSSVGSQIAASKAGFEDKFVVSYEDLQKKFKQFDFSLVKSKFYKKMSLTIHHFSFDLWPSNTSERDSLVK